MSTYRVEVYTTNGDEIKEFTSAREASNWFIAGRFAWVHGYKLFKDGKPLSIHVLCAEAESEARAAIDRSPL